MSFSSRSRTRRASSRPPPLPPMPCPAMRPRPPEGSRRRSGRGRCAVRGCRGEAVCGASFPRRRVDGLARHADGVVGERRVDTNFLRGWGRLAFDCFRFTWRTLYEPGHFGCRFLDTATGCAGTSGDHRGSELDQARPKRDLDTVLLIAAQGRGGHRRDGFFIVVAGPRIRYGRFGFCHGMLRKRKGSRRIKRRSSLLQRPSRHGATAFLPASRACGRVAQAVTRPP